MLPPYSEWTPLWFQCVCSVAPGAPGSSVQGFVPARILESVAISSSRGSSPPGDWILFFFFFFRGLDSCLLNLLHWQVVSLAPSHLGSAWTFYRFWQMYMITPPHYNIIQISYCSKHPQCSACPYLSPRKLQATTDLFTVSMIWSYVFP